MSKSRQDNKEKYARARSALVARITGKNNYQSKYNIITPWGTFFTWKDAIDAAKRAKGEGRMDVITDRNTLRKYCQNNVLLNEEGRRTYAPWRGKYTNDIGFSIELREDV